MMGFAAHRDHRLDPCRDEGAIIAQIVAATAWAQHTIRGLVVKLKR